LEIIIKNYSSFIASWNENDIYRELEYFIGGEVLLCDNIYIAVEKEYKSNLKLK
jgi:hypothetical protein